jgi:peptidoglycan/LPS O-acetylase OafA/YrhL
MSAAAVAATPRAQRVHIDAIDMVRVLTVALVVGVHALAIVPATAGTGAVTVMLHTSREVFFVLTAFVLIHAYGRGRVWWPTFWRRRSLVVLVPYLAWSIVYFLTSALQGQPLVPVPQAARSFGEQLLLGTAGYHLYFLLVSLQIYLTLPALRALLNITRRHHTLLFGACAVFQVLFSLAVQRGWPSTGLLSAWIHGPTAVLPSYLLYVVAGGVAAWHLDDLLRWTREHTTAVLAGTTASLGLAVVVYTLQMVVGHQPPSDASAVFQPVVVAESLGVAWAFLALGLLWTKHGQPLRHAVMTASDVSFGIYLSHPLLLQGLAAAASATGMLVALSSAATPLILLVLLGAVLPVAYLSCAAATALLRRTPLSLAFAGRPRLRHAMPRQHAAVGHASPAPAALSVLA